jgi:hypothetical protein
MNQNLSETYAALVEDARAAYERALVLEDAELITQAAEVVAHVARLADKGLVVDLNLGGRPRAGGLGARHPLSPKEQARILELRDAGMTRKAIAAEMKRGCRLIVAFLNANSPPKPEPKPKAPTLAAIRGANWWEPLPPFHPIAAAELERARRLEL